MKKRTIKFVTWFAHEWFIIPTIEIAILGQKRWQTITDRYIMVHFLNFSFGLWIQTNYAYKKGVEIE